jgi:hypothetical protein
MRPRVPTDLSLAPVAAEIDLNLQRLRNERPAEIFSRLGLTLNLGAPGATREERADEVLAFAVRQVDLHGWEVSVSDDATRLHLEGGSVTLEVGLSSTLQDYIESGIAV